MSEYLEFREEVDWIEVLSRRHQTLLGRIAFFSDWKEFIFIPEPNAVFSLGCLKDIAEVVENNNKEGGF